jgi:hypothetical protein
VPTEPTDAQDSVSAIVKGLMDLYESTSSDGVYVMQLSDGSYVILSDGQLSDGKLILSDGSLSSDAIHVSSSGLMAVYSDGLIDSSGVLSDGVGIFSDGFGSDGLIASGGAVQSDGTTPFSDGKVLGVDDFRGYTMGEFWMSLWTILDGMGIVDGNGDVISTDAELLELLSETLEIFQAYWIAQAIAYDEEVAANAQG